jgi:hypothetical protein
MSNLLEIAKPCSGHTFNNIDTAIGGSNTSGSSIQDNQFANFTNWYNDTELAEYIPFNWFIIIIFIIIIILLNKKDK